VQQARATNKQTLSSMRALPQPTLSRSLLHLALSLHGHRQLIFHAASAQDCSGAWQRRQVAFSCQHYMLRPEGGVVSLMQEHVLSQQCGGPRAPFAYIRIHAPCTVALLAADAATRR
jgi:hypothetical protein